MGPELTSKEAILSGEDLLFERLFDDDAKLVHFERFRHIIVGTFFHGRDSSFAARKSRDHDNFGVGSDFFKFPDGIDAIYARHHEIQQNHLKFLDPKLFHSLFCGSRHINGIPGFVKYLFQVFPVFDFVIYYQNFIHWYALFNKLEGR